MALAATIQVAVAVRSPAIAKDGITFIRIARQLPHRPLETMRAQDQHPGYPAMVLAARSLVRKAGAGEGVGGWVLAARLVAGVFGLLGVLAVWLLCRGAFNERVAGVAAVLFAVMPMFRSNASNALSDTPHLALYLLAAWCAGEGFRRGKIVWFPLAGAASGLAYWIRPEGLSVAVVAAGLLAFQMLRGAPWRRVLLSLGCLVLASGAVVAPYAAIKGGLTSKKLTDVLTWEHDAPPGAGLDGIVALPPPPTADAPPVRAPRWLRACASIVEETAHGMRHFLLVPFAVGVFVGAAGKSQRDYRRLVAALAAFHVALLFALYFTAGYLGARHVMQLVALAMPWTASGTVLMAERLSSMLRLKAARRVSPEWACALFACAFAALLLPRALRPLHRTRVPVVRVAYELAGHAEPGDAVLSNSVYPSFFAEMPGVIVSDPQGAREFAKQPEGSAFRFAVLALGSEEEEEEWLRELSGQYALSEAFPRTEGPRHVVLVLERKEGRENPR